MLCLVHPLMMKPRNALIRTQLQFKTHKLPRPPHTRAAHLKRLYRK